MLEYKYVAKDRLGNVSTDIVRAKDVAAVVSHLKKDGYLPLKVKEVKSLRKKFKFLMFSASGRVRTKEIVVFTRQLAATLSAGLVLVESLDVVSDEMENKYFQMIIRNIKRDIQGGTDFSTALSKYPNLFTVGYVALVKAGEATGRLYKSMTDLARYMESAERLREKVKSAMTYPLFILCFAFVVVLGVVLFLIPKFEKMFSQAGAELPFLTRVVTDVSHIALQIWPYMLGAMIVGIFAFKRALKLRSFRHTIDQLILRIPIIGKEIIHKSMMAQFCHTLGALLSGGVGLSTSLDITARVINNIPIENAIGHIRDRVVAGANMSDEIRIQKVFPSLVGKMVAVGERTGAIDEMLRRTAQYYDDELDNTISKLTSLIEPVLIIFIGGFICIIIVALYLPIFNVTELVR